MQLCFQARLNLVENVHVAHEPRRVRENKKPWANFKANPLLDVVAQTAKLYQVHPLILCVLHDPGGNPGQKRERERGTGDVHKKCAEVC